ncbi:hypothetical protein [Rufibacter latericius]|uniref:Entericidin n=1 Tax=Rufibacter latericius TaxID=2487040 RepID=A0A3M9MT00_9BACT|nr:hypothetical protein [Rufibacter latericius]RNI28656.1 hypothetical protein EFB08_08430 [Rufibacter latericius]
MKSIMPFFAACALLAGTACSTYTSSTDPIDLGSGTSTQEEVTTTAAPAEEAHTVAAPVKADSATAATPNTSEHSAEAAH